MTHNATASMVGKFTTPIRQCKTARPKKVGKRSKYANDFNGDVILVKKDQGLDCLSFSGSLSGSPSLITNYFFFLPDRENKLSISLKINRATNAPNVGMDVSMRFFG